MVAKKIKEESLSVALTFDIWSSKNRVRGYGTVTAHYFDGNFSISKK